MNDVLPAFADEPASPAQSQSMEQILAELADARRTIDALTRPRPEKKRAIFGTTPSRMQGPIADDSGWERWTIGPGGKDAHGWERLYEVHGTWPADFVGYLNDLSLVEPPRQVVWMPQADKPVETWQGAIEHWKKTHGLADDVIKGEWKAMVRYPREAILARHGRRMWFSSSISWLIAQAIEEQATDIGLWGIDLESGEEYISQFVGCAHLLDVARLIGINVHLPRDCGLLRDPAPYPDRYETHLALSFEKKVIWLNTMVGRLEPEFDAIKAEMHRKEGELLTLRRIGAEAKEITDGERVMMELNVRLGQLAAQINQLKGELGATSYWRRIYVWGVTDPG